jgi:hypothetical protein
MFFRRNKTMSTSAVEMPIEVSGSMPDEGAVELQDHIIPNNPAQVFDHRLGECDIVHDTAPGDIKLERLTEKKNRWGFLEGKDAALYLSLLSTPAPVEKPIDIPSLQLKLSFLLPGDRHRERRARKLTWHLSKGRRVACDWDNITLSELTPAESCMSDEEFAARYPDQVKTATSKGGRPRKYRTAKAQKKGHAERQRRYKARKLVVVPGLTRTPSQLAEK